MDFNGKITKEELVGKYAMAGNKGASKTEVELMEAIAVMHNKAKNRPMITVLAGKMFTWFA